MHKDQYLINCIEKIKNDVDELFIFINKNHIDSINDIKNMELSNKELNLSNRTVRCLKAENIHTIGDVLKKKSFELMIIPNFGRKSFNNLKEALKEYDLRIE